MSEQNEFLAEHREASQSECLAMNDNKFSKFHLTRHNFETTNLRCRR